MTADLLIKQIETYSNAIIAFMVLQGVAFSLTFGTSAQFNCAVKTAPYLAQGLVLMFAVGTIAAVAATIWLGRALRKLSGEFQPIVDRLYLGKIVVIVIFGLLPTIITATYGVKGTPAASCQVAAKP